MGSDESVDRSGREEQRRRRVEIFPKPVALLRPDVAEERPGLESGDLDMSANLTYMNKPHTPGK